MRGRRADPEPFPPAATRRDSHGWRITSRQPSPIRTGTMASNAAAGSRSSSTAPATPPISDAAEPDEPAPLTGQFRPHRQRPGERARRQADRVRHVGHHRRHTQGQQGREGDQGAGTDHGVDQTGRRPGRQRPAARARSPRELGSPCGWSGCVSAGAPFGPGRHRRLLRQPQRRPRRASRAPGPPRWPPAPCARPRPLRRVLLGDLGLDVDLRRRREVALGRRRDARGHRADRAAQTLERVVQLARHDPDLVGVARAMLGSICMYW